MAINEYDDNAGALIYHGMEIKKGINVKDHIKRAKIRLLNLEMILNDANITEEKESTMTNSEAFWIVYDRLPFNQEFPGVKFSDRCRFLTGRPKAYSDSFMRLIRKFRAEGLINCLNVGSPKNSIYIKLKTEKDIEAEKKPNVFSFMEDK